MTTNAYYTSTNTVSDDGLLTRWMTNDEGEKVCEAMFMLDHHGDAIVIQLDTPKLYRGKGYARRLLAEIGKRETKGNLRVISNASACSYYEKLGYKEIAPHVFELVN